MKCCTKSSYRLYRLGGYSLDEPPTMRGWSADSIFYLRLVRARRVAFDPVSTSRKLASGRSSGSR